LDLGPEVVVRREMISKSMKLGRGRSQWRREVKECWEVERREGCQQAREK
jgi:hypothetical protein